MCPVFCQFHSYIFSCYDIWYCQLQFGFLDLTKSAIPYNFLMFCCYLLDRLCLSVYNVSSFFCISGFKWSHISSVVVPRWFLNLTLKDSFNKPCWSIPFKIESPIIATTFLFTVGLYIWLWSKCFSSSVLSQISLLWLFLFVLALFLYWSDEVVK